MDGYYFVFCSGYSIVSFPLTDQFKFDELDVEGLGSRTQTMVSEMTVSDTDQPETNKEGESLTKSTYSTILHTTCQYQFMIRKRF